MAPSIIDLLTEPDRSRFSVDELEELLGAARAGDNAEVAKLAAEVLLERCPRHVAAQAALAWAAGQPQHSALPQFLETTAPAAADTGPSTSGTITLREILTRARNLLGRALDKGSGNTDR